MLPMFLLIVVVVFFVVLPLIALLESDERSFNFNRYEIPRGYFRIRGDTDDCRIKHGDWYWQNGQDGFRPAKPGTRICYYHTVIRPKYAGVDNPNRILGIESYKDQNQRICSDNQHQEAIEMAEESLKICKRLEAKMDATMEIVQKLYVAYLNGEKISQIDIANVQIQLLALRQEITGKKGPLPMLDEEGEGLYLIENSLIDLPVVEDEIRD